MRFWILFILILFTNVSWAEENCEIHGLPLSADTHHHTQKLTCEIKRHAECDRYFPREFEKALYMRKCGAEEESLEPNFVKTLRYCDTMFMTALADMGIALAQSASHAVVNAYMYLRHSTPSEVAQDMSKATFAVGRSGVVAAQTALCVANPICVKDLTTKFVKDISTPGSESRKVFKVLLGTAKEKLFDNINYVQCLNEEALAAYKCSAAISAFIPAYQVKAMLAARGWAQFTTVQNLADIEKAGAKIVAAQAETLTVGQFTTQYATRNLTNPLQNEAWIGLATKAEEPGRFFVDSQNRALKFINDNLKNKTLADALTNKHNEMVATALRQFKKNHPGIDVHLYSDYKGMRASIRGPPGQQAKLMKELSSELIKVDQNFTNFVKVHKYLPGEAFKKPLVATGIRQTYDESNILSRFGAGKTWKDVSQAWQQTESVRSRIQTRFGNTPLMKTVPGTQKKVLTADVFEVIRKKPNNQTVVNILNRRYGTKLTLDDAAELRRYFEQVDMFSPGLLLAKRVQHRFDLALNGGFTTDFAGVGSFNAEATAIGLTRGKNLENAIVEVRNAERVVTQNLNSLKVNTQKQVQEVLRRNNISSNITISGDDMVVVPNKPIPFQVRQQIVLAQAKAGVPSSMRTSFFPPGMANAQARAVLATEGEGVEKILRARLETVLTRQELKELIFATDMQGTRPGFGPVHLMMNVPSKMSPVRVQLIKKQFSLSVRDMEAALRSTGRQSRFTIAP